jgi:uncharacterized protein (DUF433 family)
MPVNPFERIETNPNILFGKPAIKGTRIPVSLIMERLEAGETIEQLLGAYPRLTREDLLSAIKYSLFKIYVSA